ncbi:hypothetical protein J5N97_018887 [Dioscorea zingiberensis]|uniref:Uncharacterized protein n=1 Tax=Dioscorea zingiberensis TaxID=325984 RepID=A0A9D5CDV8_9LILI|nr:hypothetical protein J5N97_018887 [Dioscorea zingiberensis]
MKRSGKFCAYHQAKGHTTEDCVHLKDAIEDLVRSKKLDQFLQQEPTPKANAAPQPVAPSGAVPLHFIAGGPGCGGESSSSRKNYARMVGAVHEEPPQKRTRPPEPITFSNEDLRGVSQPHDDALVIAVKVGIFIMYRVLVDTGSSVDIIFWDAFERMKIGPENLKPTKSPLMGFNGSPLQPEGVITLPVTLGDPPREVSSMIQFLVVRCPSSYNAIMGRPSLNTFGAVPSTYHMMLKFPTEHGCGEIKGDQAASRQCYVNHLKGRGGAIQRTAQALTLE